MLSTVWRTAERSRPSLTRQISQWADQVLGPSYHNYSPAEGWVPPVNLYEDGAHYCILVDLAGVQTADLLRVEGGRLVIAGERATPGMEEMSGPVRLHHMEIDSGRFRRELRVPDDADVARVDARYRDGFLWIRLPKK